MKNSFLVASVMASMSIFGITSVARAEVNVVDMTQGVPGYWTAESTWVSGSIAPGYLQSATSSQLTITALPWLTGSQSLPSNPHNGFALGLTGDFSATVNAMVTYTGTGQSGAGGFGVNGSSGRWAEVNATANYVDTHYGSSSGASVGSQPVAYAGTSVMLNLARTGDSLNLSYAVDGGSFTSATTLTGQYVLGAMDFYLFGWGAANDPATTQIAFSNFTYTSAPAAISGMTGGTASLPTDLSSATVGSIYGTVGDPGHESDFYTFYWGGGDFSASVGIPGAEFLTYTPDDLLFKLCDGANCVSQDSYLASALAGEDNVWETLLQASLDAGFYTIGVVDTALVPFDPPFHIIFETPTTATNEKPPVAVPEPATLALLLAGLVALLPVRKSTVGASQKKAWNQSRANWRYGAVS